MSLEYVEQLDRLQQRSLRMACLVESMLEEACESVNNADPVLARRVRERDCEMDTEEVAIEAEAIRLMGLRRPEATDLRLLCAVMKVNSELERIADCAVNIAERACHSDLRNLPGSRELIELMSPAVLQVVRITIQAYGAEDQDTAHQAFTFEEETDALYGHIIKTVVAEAPDTPEKLAAHLDLLSVAKNLERIADHATNIAENVLFWVTGQIVRHRAGAGR